MNQRQLANLLLKVSGIIGVITTLPMFVLGLISAICFDDGGASSRHAWITWLMPVSSFLGLCCHLALVLCSEKIATHFFLEE